MNVLRRNNFYFMPEISFCFFNKLKNVYFALRQLCRTFVSSIRRNGSERQESGKLLTNRFDTFHEIIREIAPVQTSAGDFFPKSANPTNHTTFDTFHEIIREIAPVQTSAGAFLFLCLLGAACTSSTPNPPAAIVRKDGMVRIPGGTLNMGGDNPQADANEYPKHKVVVKSFWMDETEVTNAQFAQFVKATGYVTVAERPIVWEDMKKSLPPDTPKPADSLLQPGALVFRATNQPVPLNDPGLWWIWVNGANWQHPEGIKSSIEGKMDHPVVQIAWEDAAAYAKWAGKRLPTEAEWEWAARGGAAVTVYPWGNEAPDVGSAKANFWQGLFPHQNLLRDGYATTAPVRAFAPNGYGLYDMAGNVWEWCSDWFDFDFYKRSEAAAANTQGPEQGYNPSMPFQQEKVVRGGSFLCNDDYCSGYRNARRMGSTPDTGLNHTGFRCARNEEGGM
jgi:formylglycine-generating enzyme